MTKQLKATLSHHCLFIYLYIYSFFNYYYYSNLVGEGLLQSVCLSVREHISGTTGPIFTSFCADPCSHGLVVLWQRCNTLYTSGFMDDGTFGHIGPCGDNGAESDEWMPCCCCYYYYYLLLLISNFYYYDSCNQTHFGCFHDQASRPPSASDSLK